MYKKRRNGKKLYYKITFINKLLNHIKLWKKWKIKKARENKRKNEEIKKNNSYFELQINGKKTNIWLSC